MQNSDFSFIGKNIIPENYNYVGYCYFFSFQNADGDYDEDCDCDYPEQYVKRIDDQVTLLANKEAKCNCCNHNVKRANFFTDEDDNLILTGVDCGSSIMKFSQSVRYSKSITLEKRKKLERARIIAETFDKYPELADDFEMYNKIIIEIRDKFFKYLKISEKQVSFIHSLAEKRRQFESASEEAQEGTNVIFNALEIVSVKFKYCEESISRYSKSTSTKVTAKITLKTPSGWFIHSNLKTHTFYSYNDHEFETLIEEEYQKGMKIKNVKFQKIQVSNSDKYFAFGKRMKIQSKIKA
jgi:hypothetical protein